MFKAIANFFRTGEDRPPMSDDPNVIASEFKRRRWSVFLSITLGYAFFYVCRLNWSVVKKPLMDNGVLDASQIGTMGMIFFFTYAIGKFLNSFIADRCNIKKFLPFGLFMASLLTIVMGLHPGFSAMCVLWGLVGWFQSYGAGPCIVSLNQWFAGKERATFYGIWFTSHNLGAGVTYLVTAALVMKYSWTAGFFVPGAICLVASILMYKFMSDRPQVYGLPTPFAMAGEPDPTKTTSDRTVWQLQLEVIKNPAVWILGLSSACCYITRYAVESWGIIFLTEAKAYTILGASGILTIMQVAGIFGAFSCGLVADKFFNHRLNVPCLIFGVLYAAATALFVWAPPAWSSWADPLSMCVYGFTMGALVCYLGGLMAVTVCPKRATGAAMGMIGLFSYAGASLQEKISGHFINASKWVDAAGVTHYNFGEATYFWVGAAVVSFILATFVWNVKAKE